MNRPVTNVETLNMYQYTNVPHILNMYQYNTTQTQVDGDEVYIDEVDGVPLDVDGVPLAKDVDGEPLADPEEEEDEDIFNMSPKKRYILLMVVSCSNLAISLYPTS